MASVFSLLLFGSTASAHHSFAAEYDNNKQVTVKGTVQKVAWVNPHAYVYIDVKDENGKVTTWAFESLSPNALARQGWTRNSLKVGEAVTTADGRKVFAGSSADDATK
jgi:DNA/RNA endonuclease YhcR with UshA esterase domain